MKAIFRSLLIITILLGGCAEDIDEISANPNNATEMYPSMIFTRLSITAFGPEFYGIWPYMNSWMMGGYRGGYFDWDRRGFSGEYKELGIVKEMVREAERTGEPEYLALAKFFRAYWIFNVTRLFGDVPFSEAAQGKERILFASYDAQEDILAQILTELEEANLELAGFNGTIDGDILYNGNVMQWRKLINTFRLRILINANQKENIKGKKVSELFAEIVYNPSDNPIMESQDDSAVRVENASNTLNNYLYGNNDFITGYKMYTPLVEFMKERQDVRLTYIASPVAQAIEQGLDPNDLNNYLGATPCPQNDENAPLVNQGLISRVNDRYYKEVVGPHHMMIGYPEQEFILAEAALRGWINHDPNEHYLNGIKASFEFYGFSRQEAEEFIQGSLIPLAGSKTEQLNKIITQKYINFFMQSGWESYFELRRTGYPDFKAYITPNLETLANDGRLPKRFMYPLSELNYNQEKVNEAIARLASGDNINTLMWLLQGEDPLKNPDPFPYY